MSNRTKRDEKKSYRVQLSGIGYDVAYVSATSLAEAREKYHNGNIDDWGETETDEMEIDSIEEI